MHELNLDDVAYLHRRTVVAEAFALGWEHGSGKVVDIYDFGIHYTNLLRMYLMDDPDAPYPYLKETFDNWMKQEMIAELQERFTNQEKTHQGAIEEIMEELDH